MIALQVSAANEIINRAAANLIYTQQKKTQKRRKKATFKRQECRWCKLGAMTVLQVPLAWDRIINLFSNNIYELIDRTGRTNRTPVSLSANQIVLFVKYIHSSKTQQYSWGVS